MATTKTKKSAKKAPKESAEKQPKNETRELKSCKGCEFAKVNPKKPGLQTCNRRPFAFSINEKALPDCK